MEQYVLCFLCLCSSDHNRLHRPYSTNDFDMINCSREALGFSKNTSDKREWKWAFATTTFAMPFEFLRSCGLESDKVRAFFTFVFIGAVAGVSGADFGKNSSSPYWIYTLHQFGVAITLVYLVSSFFNNVQMWCRYPALGDRIKTTDGLSVLAWFQYVSFHLSPITVAAMGQAIEIMNTPAMELNNFGWLLAATILNAAIFLVGALIVREHVIDWAKFLYVAVFYALYLAVVVSHPIPMNPGFLALWFVTLVLAYAYLRVVAKITMGYKDRTDTPLFVAVATGQVGA